MRGRLFLVVCPGRLPWMWMGLLGMILLAGCASFAGGSVSAVAGRRTLAESEFEGLDSPPLYGIEAVFDLRESPLDLGLELGLYHHREDRVLSVTGDTEITGTELAFGIRKTFALESVPLRPYAGIGASVFYTDRDNQISPVVGREGSDVDTGYSVRAGIDWLVGEHLILGVDARWIQESDLDYGGYNLDGAVLTARLGWSF